MLARGPVPIEMDAFQYWRLSSTVMSGDVLMLRDPIAYRTPIYPWFLALVRLISSEPLVTIVAVQGVLLLATIAIAGHIAARITKVPSAMAWTLAASLPAVSAITFAAWTLTETLFVFSLLLHLLAVMDYAKHDTVGRLIWLAMTFALTLLIRPIVILLWIAHVFFLLYIHVRRRNRLGKSSARRIKLHHRLCHGLIAAAVVAVLISPWLARNHSLFGKAFLTEFVGRNVWIVTFQDGSGAGLALPDTPAAKKLTWRLANIGGVDDWRHTWTVSNGLVKSGLSDPQSDSLMKQVAVDAIKANPNPFAWKAFRRCVNFWRCAATDLPEQGVADGNYRNEQAWHLDVTPIDWAIEYRMSQSVLANTLLAGVIALGTLLLIVRRPSRPYGIWLALMLGYFSVVTGVLEIPDYRYRIVVEPLCALVVGAAIATLIDMRRDAKKTETPV